MSEYHQFEIAPVPSLLFQKPDYRMDTKNTINSAVLISSPTTNGLPRYAPPQYDAPTTAIGPTPIIHSTSIAEPVCNGIHGTGYMEGQGEVEEVSPQKFKTKMCANFLNGSCQWGSRCAFAHGPQDLRQQMLSPVQSQLGANHVYPQALVGVTKQPPPSYGEYTMMSPTALSPTHSLPTSPIARHPQSVRGAVPVAGHTFPIGGPVTASGNFVPGTVGSLPVTPTGAPPRYPYPSRFRHSPYSPNSFEYTSESSRPSSPFLNSPPNAIIGDTTCTNPKPSTESQ